jgi:hypothetical protein
MMANSNFLLTPLYLVLLQRNILQKTKILHIKTNRQQKNTVFIRGQYLQERIGPLYLIQAISNPKPMVHNARTYIYNSRSITGFKVKI